MPGAQRKRAQRPATQNGSGLVQVQERRHGQGQAPASFLLVGRNVQNGQGEKTLSCWGFPQNRHGSGLPALLSGVFQCTLESLPPSYPRPHWRPPPPPTPKHFLLAQAVSQNQGLYCWTPKALQKQPTLPPTEGGQEPGFKPPADSNATGNRDTGSLPPHPHPQPQPRALMTGKSSAGGCKLRLPTESGTIGLSGIHLQTCHTQNMEYMRVIMQPLPFQPESRKPDSL